MSTTCMLFLHTNPLIVDFDGKVGFEPTDSRPIKTERLANKTSYQTFRKNWWIRYSSSVWVNLNHSSIFFWEISPISVVNLILNRTILSFKGKKLLTTYLSPLIFLNHKKQTHKLNPEKTTRASCQNRTDSIPGYKSGAPPFVRRKPVAEYFFKVEVNSVS